MEHLVAVPTQMIGAGTVVAPLAAARPGRAIHNASRWRRSAAGELGRDVHGHGIGHAQHAAIEQLVVQGTETESVVERVRTVRPVPYPVAMPAGASIATADEE